MVRRVQLVLLCEDALHEAFARRFLERAGWNTRQLRGLRALPGKSAAEQYIRRQFPQELRAYRTHRHRVAKALIVLIDGDNRGVSERLRELKNACQEADVPPRQNEEQVAIFIPTWNMET